MKQFKRMYWLGCLVCCLMGGNAFADYRLWLEPPVLAGAPGDDISLDVKFRFTERDLLSVAFSINFYLDVLEYKSSTWTTNGYDSLSHVDNSNVFQYSSTYEEIIEELDEDGEIIDIMFKHTPPSPDPDGYTIASLNFKIKDTEADKAIFSFDNYIVKGSNDIWYDIEPASNSGQPVTLTINHTPTVVPEPGTFILLGGGLACLAAYSRRRVYGRASTFRMPWIQ